MSDEDGVTDGKGSEKQITARDNTVVIQKIRILLGFW